MVLVVSPIQNLEIPKGDVAHGYIKKLSGICTVSKPFTEMLAFW